MEIFIGADHNGFELKQKVEDYLAKSGYNVVDQGDQNFDADDDFPVFASKVVQAMFASNDKDPRGILICGSGQGMAIAANRFKGIRAVVTDDIEQAKLARNDDNANVLALPAYSIGNPEQAFEVIEAWLSTPYEDVARRNRRIKQLDELN